MSPSAVAEHVARVKAALVEEGLLLVHDKRLPSVATLVAGTPVPGSWWGHEAGQAIYRALGELEADPDVVAVPLVAGKATLVHRRFWPALLSMASSLEPWQTDGLEPDATRLLALVRRRGPLRMDELPAALPKGRAAGDLARLLESRLLARGGSVHTEAGFHVKALESWDRWAEDAEASPPWPTPAAARAVFAAVARRWEKAFGEGPRFPWDAPPPARAKRRVAKTKVPARARKPARAKTKAPARKARKARSRDERRPARRPSGVRRKRAR